MKYLMVIFYLVNGEPVDLSTHGIAQTENECKDALVELMGSRPDITKSLLERGVRPQGQCLSVKFTAESRDLVVTQ